MGDTTTESSITTAEMNEMIEANLPLVKHIVLQVAVHFPRHVEREELARAGALGLVEAARRYDESRGVPFDRFAAQRIRGAILDAVRAADWAPRSVRTLARKLEATEQRLASRLGRVPSIEEMAEALSMDTNELNRLRDRMFRREPGLELLGPIQRRLGIVAGESLDVVVQFTEELPRLFVEFAAVTELPVQFRE